MFRFKKYANERATFEILPTKEYEKSIKDQTPKEALENAIKKWKAIVSHLEKFTKSRVLNGTSTCALCAKYGHIVNPSNKQYCHGCPVSEFSGFDGCCNTPWERDVTLSQAKAELTFLESLRK